jgi:ribosomal protein S27E
MVKKVSSLSQLLKQQFRIFDPATYSEEEFEAFKESAKGLPRARALDEFSKLKLLAWGDKIAKRIVCIHCFDVRHSNTTYAKEHLAVHCIWCPDAIRTSLAKSAGKNVMRGGQVKRKSLQAQQQSEGTSNFDCTL